MIKIDFTVKNPDLLINFFADTDMKNLREVANMDDSTDVYYQIDLQPLAIRIMNSRLRSIIQLADKGIVLTGPGDMISMLADDLQTLSQELRALKSRLS